MAAVMRALPDALAKNAFDATARAGAQTLQRASYAYLSIAMNRSAREDDVIIKRRRSEKGQVRAEYAVGPPKRKPWLRWLHDGTAPHLISAVTKFRTRRGIRDTAIGNREGGTILASRAKIFGRTIQHPGQPPRPWLEQANFAARDQVFRAMAEKLRVALARQTNRLVSSKFRRQQLRRFLR